MSLLSLLAELVAIPSVSGSEQALGDFCESHLQQAGWEVERQQVSPSSHNLLARKGPGPWPWLLVSHLDTVPPQGSWTTDPFQLELHGDQLMGLGTSDMKAGLAILLQLAAEAPERPHFQLALTVDEEVWSQGAYQLVKHPWLAATAAVLVPELGIDSPQEHLTIARRGHLCYDITLQSPVTHGAVAAPQHNPISQAAHLMVALMAHWQHHHPQEGFLLREIESCQVTLSTPTLCRFQVSILSQPHRTVGQVWQELEMVAQQNGCPAQIETTARPTAHPIGYCMEQTDPYLLAFHQVAEQVLQQSVPLVEGISVADENIFYQVLQVPVMSLAPVGGQSHQPGEWVSAASLARVMQVYRTFFSEAGEP